MSQIDFNGLRAAIEQVANQNFQASYIIVDRRTYYKTSKRFGVIRHMLGKRLR